MTPLDLQEEENRYVVYFYIQNCTHKVELDQIKITFNDGMLHIKAPCSKDDRMSRSLATVAGFPECVDFGILLPLAADTQRLSAYRAGDTIKVIIPKCGATNLPH
ncbi:MAG: Hsp20/alpha crystallin family protein [Gammaproteobacteria bacterium]|nr:Hsp20/alpha crystallin family protein [Gammaproteobacteria bacterium]